MQIDLKTVNITAKRNAFDHLVRRFGDKPATRYQEGTYDIQADTNLQYRPLWDPARQIYDPSRTRLVMKDWYDFKDPRQYYYGAYTIARSRNQETTEANFDFFEGRNLNDTIPEDIRQLFLRLLVPLRHAAWGANLNNTAMCADGYGTAITQPCMYQAMDNLGIAQYLTRIALAMDDVDFLDVAKDLWLSDEAWQPLREYVEKSLTQRDWFELFVAQNLVLDGLLYPMVYQYAIDDFFNRNGASTASLLTSFMSDWFKESSRWVDSVIKTAVSESDDNRTLVTGWLTEYRHRALSVLKPIIAPVKRRAGADFLAAADEDLLARLKKIGVTL